MGRRYTMSTTQAWVAPLPDSGLARGAYEETLMNTMTNDLSGVVAADRAHVWHHLSQHKQYETVDPRVIVEGKGLRVWDAKGK